MGQEVPPPLLPLAVFTIFPILQPMKPLLLVLFCLLPGVNAWPQPADHKALLKALANRNSALLAANEKMLLDTYHLSDSAGKVRLLAFFDQQAASGDAHTAARSLVWKGVMLRRPPFNQTIVPDFMLRGINRAVESGDPYLQVECMEVYAYDCGSNGRPEVALFYHLKAIELRKSLHDTCFGAPMGAMYGTVGNLLHRMQEYAQSTEHILRSLPYVQPQQLSSAYNTIGLNYQRLAQYDSAQHWYNRALMAATQQGDSVWKGIVSGNIGAALFDQGRDTEALPLLWQDYKSCLLLEPKNAGNWPGRPCNWCNWAVATMRALCAMPIGPWPKCTRKLAPPTAHFFTARPITASTIRWCR
jgi:tetratricopeptide (TPR) repeat protein